MFFIINQGHELPETPFVSALNSPLFIRVTERTYCHYVPFACHPDTKNEHRTEDPNEFSFMLGELTHHH